MSSILCCGGSVWLFVWLAFAIALVLLNSFAFIENPQPGKDMALFRSFSQFLAFPTHLIEYQIDTDDVCI